MTGQKSILVVEDEKRWREDILREELEEAGYQVHTSSSYHEALAAWERGGFSLLVIDVNLTGVPGNQDGVRLLEQVTAQGGRTPAIMISGSKTRSLAEESARRFHPLAFVDKTTFDVAEFIALVAQALGPGR